MEASWRWRNGFLRSPSSQSMIVGQFPARPLKDSDDALGLVEVVMKIFQGRFAHRPTPHPRDLLRGVKDTRSSMKTGLMMLTPTSPRPPNEPKFSVGLPRGDNGYVGPLCGKSLSVAGGPRSRLRNTRQAQTRANSLGLLQIRRAEAGEAGAAALTLSVASSREPQRLQKN